MIKPNKELFFVQAIEDSEKTTESGLVLTTPIVKGLPKFKVIYATDEYQNYIGVTVLAKPGTGWDHEDDKGKYKILRLDDIIAFITEDSMTM